MSKRLYIILLSITVLVNFTGLFCDIFMMDSSLYATISKSIANSNDYLNLYVNGKDWLDKPHFPFWVSAVFIDLFGSTTFAYKFPSLVFFLIGVYYTFKLSKKLYNTQVAYISTLILSSSFHIIFSNNDVRAEAILLGLVIGSTYYLYLLKSRFSLKNILLCSLFGSAAIMTKGVFVIIIPYSAILLDIIINNEIKNQLKFRWIIVFILTLLFTFPAVYAVYYQFDLHPEKIVFGENNVSGVKFFLWDSQFGRFFNTGPIVGSGDYFFFIHTLLWAFAPWAIIGFSALVLYGKNIITKTKKMEYINFFGFLVMFVLFSVSSFQLPHYTNIIFPFIAIMSAVIICNNKSWINRMISISINFYCFVFLVLILLIEYIFRTDYLIIPILTSLMLLLISIYFNSKKVNHEYKYIILGVLATSIIFIYINFSFYPKLLKYQAGSQIAFYVNENYPEKDIIVSKDYWLLQYYAKNELNNVFTIDELKNEVSDSNNLLVADKSFYDNLQNSNIDYEVLKVFDNYRITKLKPDFINYKTREKTLKKVYLIKINDIFEK